ncbi:sialic acid-binding Ig-like lectin 6 [Platichthys flesus]|uniref:sialic acid-binding Ig-like lectin 6 n=1 Tax=Platichthys flesus TaxID=8260 RepID=UPI002DBF3E69|nr:sialic acid-binding Ig-like lectin 6 [Platichthys flesus]
MMTIRLLLSVLFVSGALAVCLQDTALNITAPQTMEALSGSCLQIPCNFRAKTERNFTGNNFGVWIKSDSRFGNAPQNVIFNGSRPDIVYQVKIIGDLNQKNCTSVFSSLKKNNTDKYFFRVEGQLFTATAACHPLQIHITDDPPRPTIEMLGFQREGESLIVTCSAPRPCPVSPPKLTWNLQPQPHNHIQGNDDGTFKTQIQENISLSDKYDGYHITCSAKYPQSEISTQDEVTLNISYAPKDTLASVGWSLSAGGWVNLTCSSRANPPVNHFTWFKRNPDGATNVSEGAVYSVRATDGGVYFCEANNTLAGQRSPNIHLKEPLRWEPVLGGVAGIVLLICSIIFAWYLRSRHAAVQQTQSQTGEELVITNSATRTEEENIHYSEVDFSRQRAGLSSDSLRDSGQQQDTVYAQVMVFKRGN